MDDNINKLSGVTEASDVKVPYAGEAAANLGSDEAWRRRQRRETALHMANQTHGKHAKPDHVIETASKYLAFIEG